MKGKTKTHQIVSRRDFLKSSAIAVGGVCAGVSITNAYAERGKAEMRFGIVTDSHYADADPQGSRYYRQSVDKMGECVERMNEEKVDFLVELGDLKDQRNPPGEKTALKDLDVIENVYAGFNGPRYHVLGNHDMDTISKEQFLAHVNNTGVSKNHNYFAFDQKGLHFIVLDANYTSEGGDYDHGNFEWTDANVPPEELDWLKAELASTSQPVIVFVHQLLDGEGSHYVENAEQVREVLASSRNVLAVFQGHDHEGGYSCIDGIHYYTLRGMVEGSGEANNSYAVVDVYNNNDLGITGFRQAGSKQMDSDRGLSGK